MRLRGGVYPQDQSIRQYPFGVGGGGLSADQALPWLIDVDVFEQAVSVSNWDQVAIDPSDPLNGRKQSAGNQNDEINFDVVLAQGTWTVEILHLKVSNNGIYTVQLDGVTKGTIDGYNAAGNAYNQLGSVTGIAISTTAKYRLKFIMATKNASSSGYLGRINHVQLRRTA